MKPPRRAARAPATAKTAQDRAALDVKLFGHGARALAQTRENCPKNTNKTYNSKQKEWQANDARWRPVGRFRFHALTARRLEFYVEKGFEDGGLVHKNKIVWFMN